MVEKNLDFISGADSPCIGFCSTSYGDDICRGCYRNYSEVIYWRQLPLEARISYYQKIAQESMNYFKRLIDIDNHDLFVSYCHSQGVKIFQEIPLEYTILVLLQKGCFSGLTQENGIVKKTNSTWQSLYKEIDTILYEKGLQQFISDQKNEQHPQ